ncbi:MAG: hypothetical protein AB7I18_06340 [Candidatus Berkiella sp.]
MKQLTRAEVASISGAMVSFGGISATKVRIMVTDDSHFTVPGLLNGQQINATFYADKVVDLEGHLLTSDLTLPFSHNGHLYKADAILGGHIYTIWFNQA